MKYYLIIPFSILFSILFSTLVSSQDFSLDKTELQMDTITGSFGTQKIVIANLLNQSINITINTTDEGKKFLFFNNLISLDVNSSENFYVGYFIPPLISPQAYKFNLTFLSINQTSAFQITLNVKDVISPVIEKCTVNPASTNRTKNVSISCTVYDIQSNISTVGATIRRDNFTQDILLGKLARDEYSATYTNNISGVYNISVTATDTSNNNASYDIPLQFNLVEWSPLAVFDVDFLKVRYGQSHQRVVATLSEPTTLTARIRNFDYTTNISGNLTLILRLPDRNIQLRGDAQKAENVPKGDITAELFSDVIGRVNGEIVFFTDKEQISKFTANFTWYTVPPSFQTAWYNNPVFCWSEDYGSYYNASRKCTITMPIDTTIGDSLALVPYSIASINFTKLTENERVLTSRVSVYRTLVYVLSIVSVLAVGGAVAYYIHESW